MSKDKEILKDEKELEVSETTEETTEEVKAEKVESSEEAKTEEEESSEEVKAEEKEESSEEAKAEEEESSEEAKAEEEESSEEAKTEEEESPEETEAEEEVIELTEEELAVIEANYKIKQKVKKVMLAVAAVIAAVAIGVFVYTGYRTDFTMPVYVGLELEDVEAIEVTDEYLESELEWMVQYSTASVVVEREAKDGDIVNIDYAGSVDGEYFDGGTAEGYDLLLGSGSFIDTFEEQLEGSLAGDEVEVVVTFPEDYYSTDLAGQEAIFEVTVNEVKEKLENKLNDAYVQAVSEESTTVAEYKEEVRAMLVEQSEESRLYSLKSAAWTQLVENIQVTVYPRFTINKLSKEIYAVIEAQAADYDMTLSDYVATAGYNDESFADYVLEVAQEQYKVKKVVETIIEEAGLGILDDEMDEKVQEILEMIGFPDVETALEAGYTMDDLELNVLVEIVVEYLVEVATLVEPVEVEVEEMDLESEVE